LTLKAYIHFKLGLGCKERAGSQEPTDRGRDPNVGRTRTRREDSELMRTRIDNMRPQDEASTWHINHVGNRSKAIIALKLPWRT